MATREQIINKHPLLKYCQERGYEMRRAGAEWTCRCPLHADSNPSFFVDPDKDVWICRAGCGGGSIIDLHMRLNNLSVGEAMNELGGGDRDLNHERQQQKPERKEPDPFSDEKKAARLRKTWPAFETPTRAEIAAIAELRDLSAKASPLPSSAGSCFAHRGRAVERGS